MKTENENLNMENNSTKMNLTMIQVNIFENIFPFRF